MAFASNRVHLLCQFKQQFVNAFQAKILQKSQLFIGWQVRFSSEGIFLGQSRYVSRVIEAHHLLHGKPVGTPVSLCRCFRKNSRRTYPWPNRATVLPLTHWRVIVSIRLHSTGHFSFACTIFRDRFSPRDAVIYLWWRGWYLVGTANNEIFYQLSFDISSLLAG